MVETEYSDQLIWGEMLRFGQFSGNLKPLTDKITYVFLICLN